VTNVSGRGNSLLINRVMRSFQIESEHKNKASS